MMNDKTLKFHLPITIEKEQTLPSWEEFKSKQYQNSTYRHNYEQVDAACPVCGKPVYKRTDVTLPTYPPKYYYYCFNCTWEEVSF